MAHPKSNSTMKADLSARDNEAVIDEVVASKRDYRLLAIIGILFCTAIFVVLFHTYHESNVLVRRSSLDHARLYSEALTAFRTLYTSQVVSRVKAAGVEVTHDYHEQPNAIPLPATLSMELGERIGLQHSGATTRLFSDHPFPWRDDGGAQDSFENEALRALRADPEQPYFAFETLNGQPTLRYATADVMRESCVNCHNSHPQSPYRNWKVGDVRGVLAVNFPIRTAAAYSRESATKSFVLLAVLSSTGMCGLAIVMRRQRKSAALLYENNQRLAQVNGELESNQRQLRESIKKQTEQYREMIDAKQEADDRAVELDNSRRAALNMMCDANLAKQKAEIAGQQQRDQAAQLEQSHAALVESQRQLAETSRRAGMAEVATGVLHNVGNVLNSVNVSANLIIDKVNNSRCEMLVKASDLINQHQADLGEFITSNPKGQQLPRFITELAHTLTEERSNTLTELESLLRNVEHIKGIVSRQQAYARVSGVVEKVRVSELIDDSLAMFESSFCKHDIEIQRDVGMAPIVTVERNKVIQILVNLIGNARHALKDAGQSHKLLTITAHAVEDDYVELIVRDNGIGISAENINNIFQHGFTTRKEGHGFGLHCSALAAKEMGGSLSVASEGIGLGATFTLLLPTHVKTEDSNQHESPPLEPCSSC